MRQFATQQLVRRSWPIRWRLTALNVGVLALTLAVLGCVLLLQLDRALIDITADHVAEQALPVLQAPQGPRGADGPRGPELTGRGRPPPLAPPFNVGRAATMLVGRLTGPDTGVFVFNSGGTLIAATETDDDVEAWPQPTEQQVAAVLAGREARAIVDQQTRRTLVMLWPIRTPDGSIGGALAMARSLALTDQLQARLWSILAGGTLLALLVTGAVGLRATRSALRPLDRVIRAARRIAAGKLDERLRLARGDEIGELAEAFDSMLDRLAAVLGAQRRFVADAAHELRTPLTALGGMVEMLQLGADRGDQATVRRMLDTMDREIGRLGRLVADLLTLSRLDAEQTFALAAVELGPIVTEVAHQTQPLARGQQIDVEIDASPTVLGDADRLKQVLINLASNALAFTPPDGRIEFRLDRVNGHARLAVTDTGCGIAPEVLPSVMDRFVRGDRSRARSTGGTGLGLAIAREIVEAHGGAIVLESELGRGTRAIVELPLAERSSTTPETSRSNPSAVSTAR